MPFQVNEVVRLKADPTIGGKVYKTFEEPNRPTMVHFTDENNVALKATEDELEGVNFDDRPPAKSPLTSQPTTVRVEDNKAFDNPHFGHTEDDKY